MRKRAQPGLRPVADAGRLPDAVAEFQTALRIKPNYVDARNNLANASRRFPPAAGCDCRVPGGAALEAG